MTKEGYKKMMDELNHLESVERPNISMQIAEAASVGEETLGIIRISSNL